MVVLIPPRGEIANPQYYAHGPDIPRALEAVEAAQRTPGVLDQELDAQLVGLARLVIDPGRRQSLAGQPTITVASDLHNNTVALGVLRARRGRRAAVLRRRPDRPRLAAGDEPRPARRAHGRPVRVRLRQPRLATTSSRELAKEGAIVLTRRGRLKADGTYGPIINKIAGLRVAGYDDPFERRSADSFADRYDNNPQPGMQATFLQWLRPLIGKVDVVMVHEPGAARHGAAGAQGRAAADARSCSSSATRTRPALERQPGVTVLNGGSIGAGGTGNLAESTNLSLARFVFTTEAGLPAAGGRPRVDRPRHGQLRQRAARSWSPNDSLGSAR